MQTVFLVCAIVGGTLMLCQFVLGLLGVGHHDVGGHDLPTDVDHDVGHEPGHEADHDHDHGHSTWFTGVLTVRSVVTALTFFGLAGMAATSGGLEAPPALGVAFAAGVAALAAVAWIMRSLGRLRADGTLRIDRAVGQTGTVYLSVPAGRAGAGKVHLKLQNRIVEYQAVTANEELPTGSRVVVVSVSAPGTVEVAAAPTTEGISHVS
jgi:membrane protein implicated in regulation of membrane protease activity